MSGISMQREIKRAGDVEYARTVQHADGQARCFFCNQWHYANYDGYPINVSNPCAARFARRTSTVLMCRADNNGNRERPTDEQVQAAINHAITHGH